MLFDGLLSFVAVAGYDGVFEGFLFLVLHLEWVAFVIDEEDFDLAVGAVVLVIGGTIGEDVLVADGVVDGGEDIGECALEERVEGKTAGHGRESFHLVFSLEVVEALDAAHGSAGVSNFADEGTGTDGEDGDVGGGLDLGENLIEGDARESVAASADEDDVLASFDTGDAIEGFVEGVKGIGVRKARDLEGVEGLGDSFLVVGEVSEDVGAEIVGDDGDVVVGAEGAEEAGGGVLHVADEVVGVGGKLKEHHGGDGSLGHADACNLLLDSVFENEEVSSFEARDELVGLVEDNVDVNIDDGDVDAERKGLVVGVFDFWFCSGGRGRGFGGVPLFFEDDAVIAGGRAFLRVRGGGGRLGRVLSVARGGKGAGEGGEEDEAARMDGHHVELYSVGGA